MSKKGSESLVFSFGAEDIETTKCENKKILNALCSLRSLWLKQNAVLIGVNPCQTRQCQSVPKKSVSISVYVNPRLKNLCPFVFIRG